MKTDILFAAVLKQYSLSWYGKHGLYHWGRVLDNGLLICKAIKANEKIVTLFSIFHDSCRINEGADPDHGFRGAGLAKKLVANLVTAEEMEKLAFACSHHTNRTHSDDLTIQACWDADRLDLPRVGIKIETRLLNTRIAKLKKTINWATKRAKADTISDSIKHLISKKLGSGLNHHLVF